MLASSAEDNALPVAFFVRLIWQESGFDSRSVSSAGARGVAQFMPEVAQELGVSDPFDPREALPASAQLLRGLHAKFGNLGLAAAAYNAGPGRVLNWLKKRSGLPKETRDYVQIITGVPAEHWINAKLQPGELQVPRRVPCAQIASASELPSPSQARKPAGSHRPRPSSPAVEYMRAASPSVTPAAGPT
ncbi:MAG TPA: lytic transglycosylase domain-containing protein, partial [Bradyrhizobium sp.]|nr:lytic transglycosylase domain-containing protein [Bradyrhizobium sp.]